MLCLCVAAIATPLGAAERSSRSLTRGQSAQHVLTRLAFGPRPGQITEVDRLGWQKWVERQLDPTTIDDEAIASRIARECPSLLLDISKLQEMDVKGVKQVAKEQIKSELKSAVLLRAVYSERQFQEVIVDFWRNHFNVDVNKVPFLATHYEEHVLRQHAFGKFDDFLLATARHPAMLVYLDNHVSNKNGLNENYARELMELHTLGVDNGYTQDDVIALARVLTGWTCGWRDGEYRQFFNSRAHDSTPVTLLGEKVENRDEAAGEATIQRLARHPNTAKFISTKLCRYLVNDHPSEELVDYVAGVFRESNGDLPAVYRAIILSPQFTNAANFRAKVKTPIEFTVSALRSVAADIESPQRTLRQIALMGQPIYECLEPTGYSDQREAWLDPGVMVYRWNFSIQMVSGRLEGVSGGEHFVQPVLDSPANQRARMVMKLLLPGVRDRKLEEALLFTNDPRILTAYVLGSPAFQQQ
ncbi:MAG: DUF1800 domain-containing protein [Pirellulales bacterium]|nr:DUF1800 domain-containing protein [Pirellulales bacterium]